MTSMPIATPANSQPPLLGGGGLAASAALPETASGLTATQPSAALPATSAGLGAPAASAAAEGLATPSSSSQLVVGNRVVPAEAMQVCAAPAAPAALPASRPPRCPRCCQPAPRGAAAHTRPRAACTAARPPALSAAGAPPPPSPPAPAAHCVCLASSRPPALLRAAGGAHSQGLARAGHHSSGRHPARRGRAAGPPGLHLVLPQQVGVGGSHSVIVIISLYIRRAFLCYVLPQPVRV